MGVEASTQLIAHSAREGERLSCGDGTAGPLQIFRIADARSSSAGDPNGHLDLAPDRRLVDLELGGADGAAFAQCAEFGQ
jgi:hypothetical protein